jgi:hypothetical protein
MSFTMHPQYNNEKIKSSFVGKKKKKASKSERYAFVMISKQEELT